MNRTISGLFIEFYTLVILMKFKYGYIELFFEKAQWIAIPAL